MDGGFEFCIPLTTTPTKTNSLTQHSYMLGFLSIRIYHIPAGRTRRSDSESAKVLPTEQSARFMITFGLLCLDCLGCDLCSKSSLAVAASDVFTV